MFAYNEEGETKLIWYQGTVVKVIQRRDNAVRAEIEWNTDAIGETKAYVTLKLLKKNHWNIAKQKIGGYSYRHNLRHLEKRINY